MSRRNSIAVDAGMKRPYEKSDAEVAQYHGDAHRARRLEQTMTLREGIRLYPKAIAWSVLLSSAIIMEGFDIVLIANLMAVPAFQRKFGHPLNNGTDDYELTAAWQSGLTNGAYVGEILGLMLCGICADTFGYKKTLIGALTAVTGFIFILFFAQKIEQLLAGLILMGIPWGAFQTLTCVYAAEVTPVPLRPIMTTYVNLCWVIGQLLASGVLKGVAERTDEWAYRIPYALQWVWPVPLVVGIALAPESPWWLIRKERYEDARNSIIRLSSPEKNPSFNVDETLALYKHTDDLETAVDASMSFSDCFKGANLRRTEIVSMIWVIQAFCGSSLMGFSTYFFLQAGLDTSNAFSMSVGQYSLGAIGIVISWFLLPHVGRRPLYLGGLVLMFVFLLVIGFMGIVPSGNKSAQWAIGAMLLVFTMAYNCSVGPVCYCLVAEIPSSRLRQKTVVLARNAYNIAMIVANIITPRMLNTTALGWGAKSAFFWAGMCFLCVVYTYFRVPEPKGRTYEELDILFENRVSARKFATTVVQNYEGDVDGHSLGEKKGAATHVERASSEATL